MQIKVGQSLKLKLADAGASVASLSFVSLNPALLTVDASGTLTGVAIGTAMVQIKNTADGTTFNQEVAVIPANGVVPAHSYTVGLNPLRVLAAAKTNANIADLTGGSAAANGGATVMAPNGDGYFFSFNTNEFWKVDHATNVQTRIGVYYAASSQGYYLADGFIYLDDYAHNAIVKVNPATGATTNFYVLAAGESPWRGLAYDAATGNFGILLRDGSLGKDVFRVISPTGTVVSNTTLANLGGYYPVMGNGKFYYTDGSSLIKKGTIGVNNGEVNISPTGGSAFVNITIPVLDADANILYVPQNRFGFGVAGLDLNTYNMINPVAAMPQPQSAALSADGLTMWSLCNNSGVLTTYKSTF